MLILDSSAVEHPAVNRRVVGSNPTRGAYFKTWPDGQAVKTRPFHGCNPGSIPGRVIKIADVAQLAEQLTCNQQVNGSSPFIGFNLEIWVFSSVG